MSLSKNERIEARYIGRASVAFETCDFWKEQALFYKKLLEKILIEREAMRPRNYFMPKSCPSCGYEFKVPCEEER